MAKIAVEFGPAAHRADADATTQLASKELARGIGWSVREVLCSAGPRDRVVEEQHRTATIAIVAAGSFQYRSSSGRELMMPGSLLLGNPGQYFECGHEHGMGDRCISFSFEQRYLEELAAEAGIQIRGSWFSALRVPPLKQLSRVVARACACAVAAVLSGTSHRQSTIAREGAHQIGASPEVGNIPVTSAFAGSAASSEEWQEIGAELAAGALEWANRAAPSAASPLSAEARVTRVVRMIERCPDDVHNLSSMAREAKLSRYHFLRVFQELTALTPHQYLRRVRLRHAATRLLLDSGPVLQIALECGFGDASNFNHAFRAEFGLSPRSHRKAASRT